MRISSASSQHIISSPTGYLPDKILSRSIDWFQSCNKNILKYQTILITRLARQTFVMILCRRRRRHHQPTYVIDMLGTLNIARAFLPICKRLSENIFELRRLEQISRAKKCF